MIQNDKGRSDILYQRIANYEPKDECAKEYEELGLKELKELIEADRKTEQTEREGE